MVHNLLMQFFALFGSKIEVFETYLFDIATTHNDQPSYVKHVLGFIDVFLTLFGDWVCGTQPACAVFRPVELKNRSFQIYFFDFVTTRNDQPSFVKHVLGSSHVFFTLFGDWVWGLGVGGVTQWSSTQPANAIFQNKGGALTVKPLYIYTFRCLWVMFYLDCGFAPRLVTMGGPVRGQVEICARGVGQNGPACHPQSHEVSGWGFVTVIS